MVTDPARASESSPLTRNVDRLPRSRNSRRRPSAESVARRVTGSASALNTRKTDSDKTIDKIGSKTCDARTSEAHVVISKDFEAGDSSAFMAYVGDNQGNDAWYMDGGATDHMTDRLEWFDSLKNVPEGRWPVMITDNRRLWVRGVRRIQVKCQLDSVWKQRHIHRVLYVPELRKNLFLVGQATDKGFITTYTCHTCYLTSNEGRGKIVLIGTRVNKLYKLEMMVIRSVSHANIAAASVCTQELVLRETPAK